jgi:hypothetical protein
VYVFPIESGETWILPDSVYRKEQREKHDIR